MYGKLRPYLNKVAAPEFDGKCSTEIVPLLPTGSLDRDYLAYSLRAPQSVDRISRQTAGARMPRADMNVVLGLEIPIPKLEQQRHIVNILKRADGIRRLRKQAQDTARQLIPVLFVDMFGDPKKDSDGWRHDNLGEHLTFVTSGSRGWAKYYSSDGAKFIRSLDVRMNYLDISNPALVNPPANAESERTRVQPGDVLLTITGSRIGRVAPVPENVGEAYISQHVAILRPAGGLRPRFLSVYLSHPRGGQSQIKKLQYGQTKPGLNLNQIRIFRIPVPPLELQDTFLERLESVHAIIGQQAASEVRGEAAFSSLLQCAFSGNL